MNAIAAALSPMTSSRAGPHNGRADEARGGGFAHCLDQACDGEPPPAPQTSRASEGPQRPATNARSGRDATAPRNAEAHAADAARAEEPNAADAAAGSDVAATDGVETARDDAAAPDLAALLPGWSPPAIAAAGTASGAAAADGSDTLPAATAARGVSAASGAARDDALSRTATASDNATTSTASSSAQLQAEASEQKEAAPGAPAVATPFPAGGAFAAAAASSAAPKAAEATLPTATVQAPLGTPSFAPALATQVRWWAHDGVQQAQLLLNPAEMGPVAVKIVLDGREARIDFSADLAATRGAIEAALPALAAALDEGGLKLSGGGVHDGSAQRQPAWSAPGVTHRTAANTATHGEEQAAAATATSRSGGGRGMVDLVA